MFKSNRLIKNGNLHGYLMKYTCRNAFVNGLLTKYPCSSLDVSTRILNEKTVQKTKYLFFAFIILELLFKLEKETPLQTQYITELRSKKNTLLNIKNGCEQRRTSGRSEQRRTSIVRVFPQEKLAVATPVKAKAEPQGPS